MCRGSEVVTLLGDVECFDFMIKLVAGPVDGLAGAEAIGPKPRTLNPKPQTLTPNPEP